LYLAASLGNIKVGFQASGIIPFARDIFRDEEYKFLLAYVLINLPLLWLHQLPTATETLQRCQLILQDHYHLLQKVIYFCTLGGIQPLPNPGPREAQNINEKKKTSAILTDALSSKF
jgi:hypothetical protein